VLKLALDIGDTLAGIHFVPAAVEVFRRQAKLDGQDIRKVLRSLFSALFPPKTQQCLLVLAHDDPGVGAADKVAAIKFGSSFDHLIISPKWLGFPLLGHSSAGHRSGCSHIKNLLHLKCNM
jgi:hypothetical protein